MNQPDGPAAGALQNIFGEAFHEKGDRNCSDAVHSGRGGLLRLAGLSKICRQTGGFRVGHAGDPLYRHPGQSEQDRDRHRHPVHQPDGKRSARLWRDRHGNAGGRGRYRHGGSGAAFRRSLRPADGHRYPAGRAGLHRQRAGEPERQLFHHHLRQNAHGWPGEGSLHRKRPVPAGRDGRKGLHRPLIAGRPDDG